MKGVFFGYSHTRKGYKYFVPSSRKWFVTKDILFVEDQPYFSMNTPQVDNYDDREEYAQEQKIQFTVFLDYHRSDNVNGGHEDAQVLSVEDNDRSQNDISREQMAE